MVLTWLAPKKELKDRVQRDFAFPLDGRLVIVAEIEKYHWKEDESVWKQKRELSAKEYEVYFDNEFVCFFSLNDSLDQAYLKTMEGILRLYKAKKIYWNPAMYEISQIKQEEKKLPKATTPEEKLFQEAIKRSRKKKGKNAKPAK